MACGWEISYSHCENSRDQKFLDEVNPEVKSRAEEMATDFLDSWTGGVYGPCPVLVRPCRTVIPEGEASRGWALAKSYRWNPYLLDGRWFSGGCGSCGSRCGCESPSSLTLPRPVHRVLEVAIDGEVLDSSEYRVDRNRLIRLNGAWPSWQDLDLPDDAEGAWYVEYERGRPVPVGGTTAAGELALEYMKALCHDGSCRLPERVQTITRQGVTVGFMDKFEDLELGRTGIWLIDSWVASVTKARVGGQVFSPDVRRG